LEEEKSKQEELVFKEQPPGSDQNLSKEENSFVDEGSNKIEDDIN
jgi:hypothetical protein